MRILLFAIMIVGIILLVISLAQIAIKTQVKLIGEMIVNNQTIKFDNQNTRILSFNVSKNSNYALKIDIIPLETQYSGIEIKPLVHAMLVDDEGLNAILRNETASYVYLIVNGLEERKMFTINNLHGSKQFHMLFSTPLPEQQAKVTVSIAYASTPENISMIDVSMLIAGITAIIVYIISKSYKSRKQ